MSAPRISAACIALLTLLVGLSGCGGGSGGGTTAVPSTTVAATATPTSSTTTGVVNVAMTFPASDRNAPRALPSGVGTVVINVLDPTTGLNAVPPVTKQHNLGDTQLAVPITTPAGTYRVFVAFLDLTGAPLGFASPTTTVTAGKTTSLAITSSATLSGLAVSPLTAALSSGATQVFSATGSFSDNSTVPLRGVVTWSSSATAIATIDASGVATAVATGNAIIAATLYGTRATAQLAVNGSAQLVSIAVTPASPTVKIAATQQFTATGTFADGSTRDLTASATWTSSAPAIATISASGLATAVSNGQATITASVAGVNGSTALVVPPAAFLQALAITPAGPALNLGASTGLTLTGTFSDGSTANLTAMATWTSANPSLVTVSNTAGSVGVVTANLLSGGSTVVTAGLNGLSATTTVTVSATALQQLAVFPARLTVPVGFPQRFSALATYADGTVQNISNSVTWTSASPSVATASNQGVVSGVTAGTAQVTAAFGPITASGSATVTTPTLTGIRLSPDKTPILAPGKVADFSAYGDFSDNTSADISASVIWASATPATATISSGGQVTAVAAGTTNITATTGAIMGTIQLTVTNGALNYAERRIPFNYQDISSTGTVVVTGDDRAAALPVIAGFNFTFFGTAFTTDKIFDCTNGFLTFNAADTSTFGFPLPSVNPSNFIAGYASDLTTAIFFQTFGTAGSRQLIMQWDGGIYSASDGTGIGASLFQIVLYEGTNVIDIRYLNVDPLQGLDTFNAGVTVGVENAGGTVFTQHSYMSRSVFSGSSIRYTP